MGVIVVLILIMLWWIVVLMLICYGDSSTDVDHHVVIVVFILIILLLLWIGHAVMDVLSEFCQKWYCEGCNDPSDHEIVDISDSVNDGWKWRCNFIWLGFEYCLLNIGCNFYGSVMTAMKLCIFLLTKEMLIALLLWFDAFVLKRICVGVKIMIITCFKHL